MYAQQNKLKELFPKYGWELIESQSPNDVWIAEVWIIKSHWTPTDCYVFISFLVDPHWFEDRDDKRKSVRSINLSLEQPDFWQNDKINIDVRDEKSLTIYIKPNFEKEIESIFDSLNDFRLRFANLK